MANKCQLVRSSAAFIVQHAEHVKIKQQNISAIADQFQYKNFSADSYHKTSNGTQQTLLYLFILDSMNFCFWPLPGYEYEHLALHVQQYTSKGITLKTLSELTPQKLIADIFQGTQIPLYEERTNNLIELSQIANTYGSLTQLVLSANKSVVRLLNVITKTLTNFQDHSIYKGKQVHFYKRAQILIGDIWGKFEGKGIGQFEDIDQLTMYPDYRVPQLLYHHKIVEYSPKLKDLIQNKITITDRQIQVELRAASVIVVEIMKKYLLNKGKKVHSCEIDWYLWQLGESILDKMGPHHRTLTIYY